jgi:co-chaperonin GroES (HSP10)
MMSKAAARTAKHNLVAAPYEPPKQIRRRLSLRTPAGQRVEHTVVVEHDEDPRQALLKKIGRIPEGFVQFNRILVAIYRPPLVSKSGGGILLPQQVAEEDVTEYLWQGKAGLIVAMGPDAYQDDDTTKFNGQRNEVGDWVWFSPMDGFMAEVNGVPCREMTERYIKGRLPHPDYVW